MRLLSAIAPRRERRRAGNERVRDVVTTLHAAAEQIEGAAVLLEQRLVVATELADREDET